VPRPHVLSFLLFSTLSLSASAQAQDDADHPRVGSLMSLSGQQAAVWVAGDRIFTTVGGDFLSACAPGRGCAPIVDSEACTTPECPGDGRVLRVAESMADVSDWPTDPEGYHRELQEIRADARGASLGLVEHPDYSRYNREHRDERRRHEESPRWISRHRERGDRLEVSLHGGVATLLETPGTWAGGTFALDYVFLEDADESAEVNEGYTLINALLGDQMGVSLRAHFLYRTDTAQEAEWITAIGLSDTLQNRYAQSVVRMPSLIGTIAPEFGVILRSDRDPTWYIAWDAPFSFLVHHDVAIDIAPRVFLVDDWIPLPPDAPDTADDPVELIFMVGAGLRLP